MPNFLITIKIRIFLCKTWRKGLNVSVLCWYVRLITSLTYLLEFDTHSSFEPYLIFYCYACCLSSSFTVNNDKLYIFFSSIQKRTCASHWLLNQRMRKSHRSFHGRSSNVRRTYLLFLLPLMKSLKSTPSCVLNYQKYRYSHLLVLSFRECQDNTFFGAAG